MLANYTSDALPTFRSEISNVAGQLVHRGVAAPQATMQAYAQVYKAVQDQALTLSYIDTFWMLGVGAAMMFCMSFLLRKNNPGARVRASVH